MAEPFYNVSFKNPINANSRKPDGLYNSDSSQDIGDHASMNRPLASELSSSCTYDRNSSTSQPKSDHSFIEHGDSVGITEVSSSDKIVNYGDRNAELDLDLTLCVNHVGGKHTYPEPNPLIAVEMEQERILTGKEHGRSVGLTEVSSSDKIGSYGDRNLSMGLDLKLWVNDVVKKHNDREPNPPIAAGMEQEGILTVKDFLVPAANRKDNNMNMYSDSRNMMNAMEEFNGRYHEAIASQPTQVQCSGLVTLKQHQQKTRGIDWNEAKDLAFSSNTSRQSRSFSTNQSGMASADALCDFGREKAGQLSGFDHNSTENQFIIVEDYSATKGEVIGWPPIWAYRESSLCSLPKTSGESQQDAMEGSFVQILRNSLSVKVNTDGMPIGRKVDLNGYESYVNLARDLENMFQLTNQNHIGACIPMGNEHSMKPLSLLDPASDFVLTYEDGEGNCMLVGDVPWKMFLHKVKRLRIMKSSTKNAFAQICSKKRKAT